MKKVIAFAIAFALAASSAMAQSASGSTSNSGSNSSSGVFMNSKGYRTASSAIGPGLIASGLSCSGSASIGGAASGWGISLGITKPDDNCDTREDAKYIHGVTGDLGAAKERLCDNPKIRAAYARAGRPCAADVQHVSQRATVPDRRGDNVRLANCQRRAKNDPSIKCRVYQ